MKIADCCATLGIVSITVWFIGVISYPLFRLLIYWHIVWWTLIVICFIVMFVMENKELNEEKKVSRGVKEGVTIYFKTDNKKDKVTVYTVNPQKYIKWLKNYYKPRERKTIQK